MELQKVELTDVKELANFASSIWHEYWPCILSEDQINYMVDKFQSEQAIIDQIKNESYTYYYLVDDGEKIGYTGLSDKGDYLFLSKLYIKKEFRHKGYGALAFEKIKSLGYRRIRLTVNKNNKNTINAYLKYGFKTVDEDVTDIGSGFVMDDYIMEYQKGA